MDNQLTQATAQVCDLCNMMFRIIDAGQIATTPEGNVRLRLLFSYLKRISEIAGGGPIGPGQVEISTPVWTRLIALCGTHEAAQRYASEAAMMALRTGYEPCEFGISEEVRPSDG